MSSEILMKSHIFLFSMYKNPFFKSKLSLSFLTIIVHFEQECFRNVKPELRSSEPFCRLGSKDESLVAKIEASCNLSF